MKKDRTQPYIIRDKEEYKMRYGYKMKVGDFRRFTKSVYRLYRLHAKDDFCEESVETQYFRNLYMRNLEDFAEFLRMYRTPNTKRISLRQAADILNIDSVEV